jgi:hypothetical protein
MHASYEEEDACMSHEAGECMQSYGAVPLQGRPARHDHVLHLALAGLAAVAVVEEEDTCGCFDYCCIIEYKITKPIN